MCIAVQARRNHAPYSNNKRGRQSITYYHSKSKDHCVQHFYEDHSHDIPPSPTELAAMQQAAASHCGGAAPFPIKLHEMLDRVEEDGVSHVVSWQPHGRCFVIHQPNPFKESLLNKYFPSVTKIASFQRQLNLYGFQRITRGRDKGAYYHPLFLRGMSFLTTRIQRIKVKGTGVRRKSNPDQEPNFYTMEFVNGGNSTKNASQRTTSAPLDLPPSLVASSGLPAQKVPTRPLSIARRISSGSFDSSHEDGQQASSCFEWGMKFYALDSLDESLGRCPEQSLSSLVAIPSAPLVKATTDSVVERELAMDSVLQSMLNQFGDVTDDHLSDLLDHTWESV